MSYQCHMCSRTFKRSSHLIRHMNIHTGEKPYQCDVCKKSFTAPCILQIHMRSHTGEKPFQCNICEKSFAALGSQVRHMISHSNEKPYQCDVCQKWYKSKYFLRDHMRNHRGENTRECKFCHNWFRPEYLRRIHMRTHTRENPYRCKICSNRYESLDVFVTHVKRHAAIYGEHLVSIALSEGVETEKNLKESTPVEESNEGEELGSLGRASPVSLYRCGVCSELFQTEADCLDHMKDHLQHSAQKRFVPFHSEGQIMEEEKSHDASSFNELLEVNRSFSSNTDAVKPYHCGICHETFEREKDCVCHLRVHITSSNVSQSQDKSTDDRISALEGREENEDQRFLHDSLREKSFQCGLCQEMFDTESDCITHMKLHHDNCIESEIQSVVKDREEDMPSCKEHQAKELKEHLRGVRSHRCGVCLKTFMRASCLVKHRTHTEEKAFTSYQCSFCFKSFTSPSLLSLHIQMHTREKPYKCETCHKSFAQLGNHARHMMKHTQNQPHHCSICLRRYKSKCALKVHMKIHDGEKMYQCKLCNRRFESQFLLGDHKKTHAEESLQYEYKCRICSKGYNSYSLLRIHKKRHRANRLEKRDFIPETEEMEIENNMQKKRSYEKHRESEQSSSFPGSFSLSLYRCGVCDDTFKTEKDCVSHMKEHKARRSEKQFFLEKSTARNARKPFSSSAKSLGYEISACEKPLGSYRCGVCGDTFEIEREFVKHCANHVRSSAGVTYLQYDKDEGTRRNALTILNEIVGNLEEDAFVMMGTLPVNNQLQQPE